MTQLLIRTFVKGYQDPRDPAVRTAYGPLAGIVGILCNVLLFAGKFTVGMVFGSIAVTADAVNNLSDASSNVVSLLGFKLGAKKPDEKHPYGYARYEYLAGLAVSVMILVIGLSLLKESALKILHPEAVTFSVLSVTVLSKIRKEADLSGEDDTEAITKAVRVHLAKQSALVRRTLAAFPYARLYSKPVMQQLRQRRKAMQQEIKAKMKRLSEKIDG